VSIVALSFCVSEHFVFCLQEAELEARREQQRMEEYRRHIIEQERQRMLKEHASKLLGFLPKVGVSSSTCTHVFYFLYFGNLPSTYIPNVLLVSSLPISFLPITFSSVTRMFRPCNETHERPLSVASCSPSRSKSRLHLSNNGSGHFYARDV